MVVRFSDVNGKFRSYITELVEYVDDKTITVSELNNALIVCLNQLKNNNYDLYTELVGLMASDHYKQLIDKKYYSMLTEDDKEKLQIYEDLYDQAAAVDLYENNEYLLIEALLEMYTFNTSDYFYKRQLLLRFKDNFSELSKFSNLNIYDYLYYCQKYNVEILKNIYDGFIENGLTKTDGINNLISTINELGMTDIQNYVEIISELLILYYNISTYELANDKHIDKLNILKKNIMRIEKAQARELLYKFNDDKFASEILHRIINFKSRDVDLKQSSDVYDHTVKKLESIKRIFT